MRTLYPLTACCVALALAAAPAIADDDDDDGRDFGRFRTERVSVAPFIDLTPMDDGTFMEVDGTAMLVRTRTGVGFTLHSRELEPDTPYTTWWVAFNRPRKCIIRYQCGSEDLFNPDAEVSVFYASGAVSDSYGQVGMSGEVDYGELPEGFDQVPFPGLDHPIRRNAEIHLVLRTHGPASFDPDMLEAQLTEFNGGCPPNECADVQASIHRSPLLRTR